MKKTLGTLRFGVDYLRGRYVPFVVENAAQRRDCMAVLDDVRRKELNRVYGATALDSAAFGHAEDTMLGCRDRTSGQVVGCVRSTRASQLAHNPASQREYRLDLIPEPMLHLTGIATRLAFLKTHRKSPASLRLLQKMYRTGLEQGYLFCVLTCEPALMKTYLRLGFRPLGAQHSSPKGGFRIPMICVNHDLAHLKSVGSPLARILTRWDGPLPTEGVAWYRDFEHRNGPVQTGVQPCDIAHSSHAQVTRDMSASGTRALLKGAMTIACHSGQIILREEDGSRYLGIVESGAVRVQARGKTVGMLRRGAVFGELASLLRRNRALTIVAAEPGTRVTLLSQHAANRVHKASDREALWRNLAEIVAQRLADAHQHTTAAPEQTHTAIRAPEHDGVRSHTAVRHAHDFLSAPVNVDPRTVPREPMGPQPLQ